MSIFNKIFRVGSQKSIKSLQSIVEKINSFETDFSKLSDEQLKEKTKGFKKKLKFEKNNSADLEQTLKQILPEAFALVRESAKRTLNQRHFDVQLIGDRKSVV